MIATVLVAVLVGVIDARAQEDDPADLLASGRAAFESEDYERARSDLWAYLDATARVTGHSRLPQAEALYYIALMEPDATVAAQHYHTIVTEYPAATVADQALLRLGVFELVEGRPIDARNRFVTLARDYPFSRAQPEIPLWVGRTQLVEEEYDEAIDAFLGGFAKVRSQDLPQELTSGQRDALAAEYTYWLATTYRERGDRRTATQYYSRLALDYPSSPQAAEARAALEALGEGPITTPTPSPDVAMGDDRDEPITLLPPRPAEQAIDETVMEPSTPDRPSEDEIATVEAAAERARLEAVEEPDEPEADQPPEPEEDRGAAAEIAPQPVEPAEDPPIKFPPPRTGETVDLQVGAFTSATLAANLSRQLKGQGFDTRVQVGIVEGQGYYRVRTGPYRLPDESSTLSRDRDRLRALGFDPRQVPAEEE
jgi:TolA-binding protein